MTLLGVALYALVCAACVWAPFAWARRDDMRRAQRRRARGRARRAAQRAVTVAVPVVPVVVERRPSMPPTAAMPLRKAS